MYEILKWGQSDLLSCWIFHCRKYISKFVSSQAGQGGPGGPQPQPQQQAPQPGAPQPGQPGAPQQPQAPYGQPYGYPTASAGYYGGAPG